MFTHLTGQFAILHKYLVKEEGKLIALIFLLTSMFVIQQKFKVQVFFTMICLSWVDSIEQELFSTTEVTLIRTQLKPALRLLRPSSFFSQFFLLLRLNTYAMLWIDLSNKRTCLLMVFEIFHHPTRAYQPNCLSGFERKNLTCSLIAP